MGITTSDYRTRTIMTEGKNPSKHEEIWDIGIDMGYSSVKGRSRNNTFSFPSYAKKLSKDIINVGQALPTDILYRDKSGDTYAVGLKAESFISKESTNESSEALYGRNRYYSDNFRICLRAGLALGLQKNEFGDPTGKRIRITTGLPPKYMTADDKDLLKEAFSGNFSFELKIGKGEWEEYNFSIDKEDIRIMQQPMGTMVAISINKEGRPTQDAESIFKSNVLILDGGFKTLDTTYLQNGSIDPKYSQTFDDLSMFTILQKTCDEIEARYGEHLPVPAIQPYLETGKIRITDRHALKSTNIEFGEILEDMSKAVFEDCISRLCDIYNYFEEVDYLVLSGGTGAAWSNLFRERLENMETISILRGNRTTELPHLLSNAIGYYNYSACK